MSATQPSGRTGRGAHLARSHRPRLWSALGEVGFTLITLGLVVLLFAGYQLWGTGVAEARSQRRLGREFAASTGHGASPTTTTTAAPTTTAPAPISTTAPAPTTSEDPVIAQAGTSGSNAPIAEGHPVGFLDIARIGLKHLYFVQGIGESDLQQGPGHYPGTPYPGEAGNAAIAGHRTTWGAPFYRLNELQPGDPILVTTRAGQFTYVVSRQRIVKPSETSVLDPTAANELTLTTCNPRYNATQRLIVVALLQNRVVARAQVQEVPAPAKSTPGGGDQVVVARPSTASTVLASPALAGEKGAWPAAILWGLAFVALWILTRLAVHYWRQWRRWASLAAGVPLCLAVLWPFFENVTRLLPANL